MKLLNQIEKAFLLKKTFLFDDLNLEHLFAIASKLDLQILNANEYIFKNDQSPLHLYIIAKGTIQLLDPANNVLTQLGEGDLFGDEALFNDQQHQYMSKTITKCQLLTLSKKHLATIISECPSVAINLLEAFAKHIPFRHATTSGQKETLS